MESFNDTSDFGCRTICLVRTNGDLYYETDKSETQKTIINELVKDKYYKYTYAGLDSPKYIGKYLRTNDNRSFFQNIKNALKCIKQNKYINYLKIRLFDNNKLDFIIFTNLNVCFIKMHIFNKKLINNREVFSKTKTSE